MVRKGTKGIVPEGRLIVIARSRKSTEHAKELLAAQASLNSSNFIVMANKFLTTPIKESIESNNIVLNILALVDRRVGKKRIVGMAEKMKLKYPVVRCFYELLRVEKRSE